MSSGGEEAILEDDSAGSYLAEALSMSSVGPDIDKGVGVGPGTISTMLWSILKSMVVLVLMRPCWRVSHLRSVSMLVTVLVRA